MKRMEGESRKAIKRGKGRKGQKRIEGESWGGLKRKKEKGIGEKESMEGVGRESGQRSERVKQERTKTLTT